VWKLTDFALSLTVEGIGYATPEANLLYNIIYNLILHGEQVKGSPLKMFHSN
jgi:hypothetical protein